MHPLAFALIKQYLFNLPMRGCFLAKNFTVGKRVKGLFFYELFFEVNLPLISLLFSFLKSEVEKSRMGLIYPYRVTVCFFSIS